MVLVFGGAYQGKLNYVTENYKNAASVFKCGETAAEIDFTKDIIYAFHLFVLALTESGADACKYVEDNIGSLRNKIIVCDDISSGIVPMEPKTRLWRETNGRCMTLLAANADEVVRVFCGMGMRLK